MIAKTVMIDQFVLPVSYANTEVLRKKLVKVCSTNSVETKAAERAYDLLFKTELGYLPLGTWEKIELSDLTDTESLENISKTMEYFKDHVNAAINEVASFIPKETIDLLRDNYASQDPLMRLSVMIFVVSTAALEDFIS